MRATAEFVIERFNKFNAEIFGGKLPPLVVRIGRARNSLGCLSYKGIENFYDFKLTISSLYDLAEQDLEDVIIHEMIHYYIAYFGIGDTSSHGKEFRRIMTSINKKFNRNVVVQRKNDKLADGLVARPHIVGTGSTKEGKIVMTVIAKNKIHIFWSLMPKLFPVVNMRWYVSYDNYFDKFPRVVTPKLYIVDDSALAHLADAKQIVMANGGLDLEGSDES